MRPLLLALLLLPLTLCASEAEKSRPDPGASVAPALAAHPPAELPASGSKEEAAERLRVGWEKLNSDPRGRGTEAEQAAWSKDAAEWSRQWCRNMDMSALDVPPEKPGESKVDADYRAAVTWLNRWFSDNLERIKEHPGTDNLYGTCNAFYAKARFIGTQRVSGYDVWKQAMQKAKKKQAEQH